MKLFSLLLCLLAYFSFCFGDGFENKSDYWNVQRKGANYFNHSPSEEWFAAAKEIGIQFVRLAPDKWQCEKRDFLIGDADLFIEIPQSDLTTLKNTLDQAERSGIKVVITLLSLPGSRWRQNNHGKDDLRIWKYKNYHAQAACFWKTLAKELKSHPAVVGYNLLNEPHPECLFDMHNYSKIDFAKWNDAVKGSAADLNGFYKEVVSAIREVDPFTPIIIETGLYATPAAIGYLMPLGEDNILYSFHMYEPYAYTTRKINKKRFFYPGHVPLAYDHDSFHDEVYWDLAALEQFFTPILLWQMQFNIPSFRILVGEFGCDRTAIGVDKYLLHLTHIFNRHNWHWAFYAFREDRWDSMDYELGGGQLHSKYWDAVENNKSLDPFRTDNSTFRIIKQALKEPTVPCSDAVLPSTD